MKTKWEFFRKKGRISFSDYLGVVVSIVCAITILVGLIIFVFPNISSLANDMSQELSIIVLIIVLIIALGIAIIIIGLISAVIGVICGYVVAIVICPIGYPLYVFICKKLDEKAEKKKQEYLKKLEKLSLKFSDNEFVHTISNDTSKLFIDRIESADLSSHIEKVVEDVEIEISQESVKCSKVYSFVKERYSDMDKRLDREILGMSIVLHIRKTILNYLKNETIDKYSLTYDLIKSTNFNTVFKIYYETPNKKYIQTKSW